MDESRPNGLRRQSRPCHRRCDNRRCDNYRVAAHRRGGDHRQNQGRPAAGAVGAADGQLPQETITPRVVVAVAAEWHVVSLTCLQYQPCLSRLVRVVMAVLPRR